MDHLIDDSERLKRCPFCGSEAEFNNDATGWIWIECLICGASTNKRISVMEDCKPLLLEQWNKRITDKVLNMAYQELVSFRDAYTGEFADERLRRLLGHNVS